MMDPEIVPEWVIREYNKFSETVTDPTFPCYFGMAAEKKGELRYSYISHEDWSTLPETLRDFMELFRKEEKLIRHGFFLFVEPEEEPQDIPYYREYFWRILQYLHEEDKKPWPAGVPVDPDHHLWDFSFDGISYFVFGNTPAYKQRKTRNLGQAMVLGFQPRLIFEGLEGTSKGGAMSREKVRLRVEKWDRLPKHPDIGHYGDIDHREWKQYFIGDDCEPISGPCPFHYEGSK
ncbi:MAG: YqcI/YcgG family protein [Bacillus sp. (in: firmicutes)]